MSTAIAAARAKTRGKRMLREALEGYGEDEFTLSEWNAKKKEAAEQGKWTWKHRVVDTNRAIKSRIEKRGDVQDAMKDRFVDISAAMQQEINQAGRGPNASASQQQGVSAPDCCEWSERIGGKRYRCTNVPVAVKGTKPKPEDKKNIDDAQGESAGQTPGGKERNPTMEKRFCVWHVRECQYKHHSMELSRAIDIANDQGMCLRCYESTAATERKTLQRSPPRIVTIKTPGVCLSDEKSTLRREMLYKAPKASGTGGDPSAPRLTASSTCCWQKEHFEVAYVWRCTNRVLMHPTLRGSYLPFCGFHAPRCIRDYGRKRTGSGVKNETCTAIERRNPFGMCRNHLEAQLSDLVFEARGAIVLADSEFDVPGIKECKKEAIIAKVARHPLAPSHPPPSVGSPVHGGDAVDVAVLSKPEPPTSAVAVVAASIAKLAALALQAIALLFSQTLHALLNHSNPVSAFVKEAVWRFQFVRRASIVAIRIQRIFRGNRARRQAHRIRYEAAALRRIAACRVIQRIVRGFLGRRRFIHESERVAEAVPHMQRLFRGGLARLHSRRLRAAIRLQRNYRWYRQRLLAWNFREEVAYMRSLQREADSNLRTLEQQLAAFRRIRARRVLRSHVERWRHRKETKQREAARQVQTLLGTIKIQRQWRRHRRLMEIKTRYEGAQRIQKRVRGWLTRHMWRNDPGVLVIVSFVSPLTALEYGRTVVLPLRQANQAIVSYAFPTRRVRMRCGAISIQRVFRGHLGRLRANAKWAAMLKGWEWIGISPNDSSNSSDSMTLGKERYGFVLSSYGYHLDSRQHMRPVVREAVVDRGHAYKYQFILDLIKDRDGKRAWSMERERKWVRDHERRREKASHTSSSLSPGNLDTSPKRLRRQAAPVTTHTPMVKALYPVGSLVDVEQVGQHAAARRIDLSRGPVTRRGRVVAVNPPVADDQEPTFDIAYIQTERVKRRVAASRVSHAVFGADKPISRPKKPVGAVVQAAIDKLKRELDDKECRIQSATLPYTVASDDEALPTIEAVADRLRDTRDGRDLLVDQCDFVNFVFRNAALLELKWLEVVDLVRHSGQRDNGDDVFKRAQYQQQDCPPNQSLEYRTHPTLAMLCQEFESQGSEPIRIDNRGSSKTITVAERANEIERRMTKLGFRRSANPPAAQVSRELSPDDNAERADQQPQLPETGMLLPSGSNEERAQPSLDTLDDLKTAKRSSGQSSQDILRFIYELKALPRQQQREKIIQVTARNARSFICGHPACGRCFSSQEAARMHQKTTHEGQTRLASAAPLIDQYLHSYWPPQRPWTDRDAASAPMIGYFACSQSECRCQFRTRRELHGHLADAHDIDVSSQERATVSQSSSTQLRKDRSSPATDTTVLWLGPFVLCRSLSDKLAVPWKRFEPSEAHPIEVPDDCATCRLFEQLPVLPCRCHVSVAFSIPVAAQDAATEEDKRLGDQVDAEFAIFSTEDPHSGVAVNAASVLLIRLRDGVPLRNTSESGGVDGKRRRVSPRRSRLRPQWTKKKPSAFDEQAEVMFIQSSVLCRDARNEAWVIGHPFVSTERMEVAGPSKTTSSGREVFVTGDDELRYNVELDRSRIAVTRLRAVVGAAVVLEAGGVSRAVQAVLVDERFGDASDIDALSASEGPVTPSRPGATAIRSKNWRTFELFAPRRTRERITTTDRQLSNLIAFPDSGGESTPLDNQRQHLS